MHSTWQLQDAKNSFSEVASAAAQGSPQIVTKHGKEFVVVLSMQEWREFTATKKSLGAFLLSSRLLGAQESFVSERQADAPKDVFSE